MRFKQDVTTLIFQLYNKVFIKVSKYNLTYTKKCHQYVETKKTYSLSLTFILYFGAVHTHLHSIHFYSQNLNEKKRQVV